MQMKMATLEKWTQSLTLLFEACRPLTFDCILTKEEIEARNADIERHTFYCLHVQGAIEDGVEPLSWDDWSDKESRFNVEATMYSSKITEQDLNNIAADINAMYGIPFQKDR